MPMYLHHIFSRNLAALAMHLRVHLLSQRLIYDMDKLLHNIKLWDKIIHQLPKFKNRW